MYEYVIRPPPPQTKNPPLFGWRKGKEKNWWGLNIFSCDLSKYFLSKIKRKPSESHLITKWRKCSMQLDMGLSNDSNPLLFSFLFFLFLGLVWSVLASSLLSFSFFSGLGVASYFLFLFFFPEQASRPSRLLVQLLFFFFFFLFFFAFFCDFLFLWFFFYIWFLFPNKFRWLFLF